MPLPSCVCGHHFRYVILCLGLLCLTSVCSNYIVINFTFICMVSDDEKIDIGNGTMVGRYEYSPLEKGAITWAVAAGTIIGTVPINFWYIKSGARWPFFVSGMMSVFSTAALPLVAFLGLPYLLVFRFVQGLAYSADFAAIGILCVRWAPLSQMGLFISALTSFTSVSVIVTDPLTAWLCNSSLGWRSSFYLHAAFGFLVFTLWIIFYVDDPQSHPNVSEKELAKIQKEKTQAHIERDSFVPYQKIMKNKTILVVWFNAFVELVSITMLYVYAPTYFNSALGFDVSSTGLLVSFAALSHLLVKLAGGVVSDTLACVTETTKMRAFNTFAVGFAGIFCLLMGVFPAEWPKTGAALFTGYTLCTGLNPGGFYKCATLTSRQYAHFVLATIQFMKCVALFVAPAMVALLVHDERRHDQWRYVFWINGALLILANAVFLPVATDKPAPFTSITRRTSQAAAAEKKRSIAMQRRSSRD